MLELFWHFAKIVGELARDLFASVRGN